MSDDQGLPALAAVMVVSCAVLMFATNKFFGQPTFFSPDPHSFSPSSGGRGSTPRSNSGSSSRGRMLNRRRPSDRSVFDDLPEFGVLEVICSFLSPAELVGSAIVSTRFCRAATWEHLWKAHCETLEPRRRPLGEAWRANQQRRHGRHRLQGQGREAQGGLSAEHSLRCTCISEPGCRNKGQRWPRRRPRLSSPPSSAVAVAVSSPGFGDGISYRNSPRNSLSDALLPDPDSSAASCCRSGGKSPEEGRKEPHREKDAVCSDRRAPSLPPAPPNGGTGGRGTTADGTGRQSSLGASRPPDVCCDHACFCYSWREAFFRAHRAKPQDLLEELSSRDQERPLPSPPLPGLQRCIVVVHGNVHDLTDFLPFHPGGALILEEHASTDATAAFERFFHSREARRMAKKFVVWDGEAVMGRRGTLWKVARKRHSDSSCS
ncbi:unnamed protein product [Scytosiphon promiscuus]